MQIIMKNSTYLILFRTRNPDIVHEKYLSTYFVTFFLQNLYHENNEKNYNLNNYVKSKKIKSANFFFICKILSHNIGLSENLKKNYIDLYLFILLSHSILTQYFHFRKFVILKNF